MSAYTAYGHDHLVFARQQSSALKALDWENRVPPLKSWSSLLAPWLGLAALDRDHPAICDLNIGPAQC